MERSLYLHNRLRINEHSKKVYRGRGSVILAFVWCKHPFSEKIKFSKFEKKKIEKSKKLKFRIVFCVVAFEIWPFLHPVLRFNLFGGQFIHSSEINGLKRLKMNHCELSFVNVGFVFVARAYVCAREYLILKEGNTIIKV